MAKESVKDILQEVEENVELQEQAIAEEKEAISTKSSRTTTTTKKRTPKKRKKLDKNMLVTIMNTTNGQVVYKSKQSGAEWRMLEYGDIVDIELTELIRMKSSNPRYLTYPFVIIIGEESEDVIEYLGLTNLYDTILTPEEVDKVLNTPMPKDRFEKLLKNLATGMKTLIIGKMKERIQEGTFDSYSKIKSVEELFKVDLSE